MNNSCRKPLLILLAISLSTTSVLFGAERQPAPPEPIRGPFFSGTVKASYPDKNTAMKGIVVRVGPQTNAYVCYDTDLLRMSLGWTGKFLEFGNGQREIVHPPPPQVSGTPAFGTLPGPGWSQHGQFADPRAKKQGPLPKDWAHYRGLYQNGDDVILSYTVGQSEILEMPGGELSNGETIFTRIIQIKSAQEALSVLVAEWPKAVATVVQPGGDPGLAMLANTNANAPANSHIVAALRGAPEGARWEAADGRLSLQLPASPTPRTFQIAVWAGPESGVARVRSRLSAKVELINLASLCKGGPAQWNPPVVTSGMLGTNSGPYVVDTISETLRNPWNARTYFSGFDFFPDGRMAICTFHGDVWVVSGVGESLDRLVWKRFATGMFQPLGLKIVDNTIYVTCRDQLNRLHDLNGDGEADYYENFNNDTVVTENYHEFCLDLQTDAEGNFYYCKGSPWPPDVRSPHQGTMLKVSKDGSKMEVFATGLRAPNGMTIGENGIISVSDNQGHWMPASKLSFVKKGGFYGMTPAAHLDTKPTDFDKPVCWLPMSMDSSSGGQAWVTGNKWGPLKDHILFSSYGKGTLFYTMTEEVDGVTQAGMVRFPFKFQTGLMRLRINPKDGQLYGCGLRGWQTDGTKDGGFYRIRYNGEKFNGAVELHAAKNGMQITFSNPLNETAAVNPENYSIEEWNYKYSGEYGSPEFSVANADVKKHDPLKVETVRLSVDKKTVFLEMPDIKPCDNMKIKYRITAADGSVIQQEIYNTIYKLGAEKKLSMK